VALFDEDQEQKTEDATPRRRQEAREKGQVPLSAELVAALVLIGWLASFAYAGGGLLRELGAILRQAIASAAEIGREELDARRAAGLCAALAERVGWRTLSLIAPLFALSVLAGYGQIGFSIASKALELDPGKLDPLRGLRRVFSLRSATRSLLGFVKLALIGTAVGVSAWSQLGRIVATGDLELGPALAIVGHVVLRCTAAALATVLALALLDLFLQRRQFEKDLRMTKQEVREELRSTEGDPQVKARIRRVQREMAARRMMAEVPRSTVVITNPTHYAVALSYDREQSPERRRAPRVVAKGVDLVARRIKELARESGVVVYEDAPLARTLHARCEIGDEVPLELYQAVAEVLAYVYSLRTSRAPLAQGADA
jgi:flagellar biosynthetic protein FlhB